MKSKIKLIVLIIAVAAVLSAGCVNSSPKEAATPTSTPIITPPLPPNPPETVTVTPTPVATPELSYKELFKESSASYQKTTSSKIYSGEMNGPFVIIYGKVYNVLPRTTVKDLNGSSFDVIDFQIWGNALNQTEPIYIETLPEIINGTFQKGISVEIKGFLIKNWRNGTNTFGGRIDQPFIYGSTVTIIPENTT